MKIAIIREAHNPEPGGPQNWPWQAKQLGDEAELPGPDWEWHTQASYDALLAAGQAEYDAWHQTRPDVRVPAIYAHMRCAVACTLIPYDQPYNVLGLKRQKKDMQKGLFTGAFYYAPGTTDPVVEETVTYEFDADNYLASRTLSIMWYDETGSPFDGEHEVKVTTKSYTRAEAIRYGKMRRENVIDQLMSDIGQLLSAALGSAEAGDAAGQQFLAAVYQYVDRYVQSNDMEFASVISAFPSVDAPFLEAEISAGVTVRQHIVDALQPPY